MKFELSTFHRNIPDQELLDDLKKVAAQLGKDKISRAEYEERGKFSASIYERRFGSWNKAIEKAGLDVTLQQIISDEELLDDLKKTANRIGENKISIREYTEYGKFNGDTLVQRFGSWNKAIKKAGLSITLQRNISDEELFGNIEKIWIKLGRQPLHEEIRKPNSLFSPKPYETRFGTWRKALEAFIEFINLEETHEIEPEETESKNPIKLPEKEIIRHTTKRSISNRLKVQVLIVYGNKCKLCGTTVTGENIHFDHIKPWSKGGETILENLQVLCAEHNLAKGNWEYDADSQ